MPVVMLLIGASSVFAAEATQMWKCEAEENITEAQMKAMAGEWVKAAKAMPGGAGMEVHLYFPVAVNDAGDFDLWLVIVTPSFEDWGKFWDNYEGSPAEAIDMRNAEDGVACPDSAVFESVKIE